jgi:hypothetical protein
MTTGRRIAVGVFGLTVIFGIISLMTTTRTVDHSSIPSTYSAGSEGCKALYLVMKDLDISVSRFRRPYTKLKRHTGVLVFFGPSSIPFTHRELIALKEWISRGNRLVMFREPGFWEHESEGSDDESDKDNERAEAGKQDTSEIKDENEDKDKKDTLDKRYMYGPEEVFELKVDILRENGRNIVPVSEVGVPGAEMISVSRNLRWITDSDKWSTIVRDGKGPIVVERQFGQGRITAVADTTLANNRNLEKAQNLRFVLALLLRDEKNPRIRFDEHHHGHIESDSLTAYIRNSVFGWIIVQAALAALLFFASKRAEHPGRYRSLAEPSGRSSLEHVESLANVFALCKADMIALEAVFRRFMTEFGHKTGLRYQTTKNRVDIRTTVPEEWSSAGELIEECLQAIDTPSDDGDRAVELARRLASQRELLRKRRRFTL